nr:acetylxylan esterase [Pirellula sp.]
MTAQYVLSLIFAIVALPCVAMSQIRPPNYEEALVPSFELPDVLLGRDGKRVESADGWEEQRTYLVETLANGEYGFAPQDQVEVRLESFDDGSYTQGTEVYDAIRRRQFRVTLIRNGRSVAIDLLLWSPRHASKPAACFLGLNFRGNQSTTDDPNVRITESWCDSRNPGVVDNRATDASRANQLDRWPIREIVGEGYALASAYYGDIDPDFDDGFENGVHALYPDFRCSDEHPERWGTIAAWAWGLSRLAD